MSDGIRALALAAVAAGGGLTWMAVRAAWTPIDTPLRAIGELRLAQVAALLLACVAGASLGFTAAGDGQTGGGWDVALTAGFLVVASTATLRQPREALTILALAFAAHALIDILHRPEALPTGVTPRWYLVGCASFNLYLGAVCYLPVLRR